MEPCIIIAEAGVNHNGDTELAFKLVDAAASAGADYIKFQTFKTELLVTRTAGLAEYQKRNQSLHDDQFQMLKSLELSPEQHFKIRDYCAQKSIEFLSTPFDGESAEFLLKEMGLGLIKVGSGDLTNAVLLAQIAGYSAHIILSSGMAYIDDIKNALHVIDKTQRGLDVLSDTTIDWQALQARVSLLHCVTDYPAEPSAINLNAIKSLKRQFPLRIGYSDHALGNDIALASIAMGARILEKHITLDRNMAGPDHRASSEPIEFSALVRAIRTVEQAMGDGIKRPQKAELKNRAIACKYLVAKQDIQQGTVFSIENLTVKRVGREGHFYQPIEYFRLLGQPAWRDFGYDEPIEP